MTVASYVASVAAAFLMIGIFLAFAGFPVLDAYFTIFTTSFRSARGFISTLNVFVPLLLLTLAFSVPLLTWKFNIGGEGQMLVGAVGATAVGIMFADVALILLLPLALIVGASCGALWAGVAAILRNRSGIPEVLTTVLLNFVAILIVAFVAGQLWPDPIGGHALYTIPVGEGARLPTLIARPLHTGLLLALLATLGFIGYVGLTPDGYEFRATGANERAAALFGVNVQRAVGVTFLLGGASAGLAGAIEVAGVHGRLVQDLQGNFMLLGIAIGLLSKGSIVAVAFVAFAVSVLEIGASATQRTIGLPAEMVLIVVGLVLLLVLLSDLVRSQLRGVRWIRS